MRIGILGGSFNPIHNGHLFMAQIAKDHLKLDKVIFMPAYCSPHKIKQQMPEAKHRLKMIELAIAGKNNFEVSRFEIDRGGVSYTINTLRSLKQKYKNASLFWIIGEDNIAGLNTWKSFDQIIKLASFIAVSRALVKVSSSQIRQLIRDKKSIAHLAPSKVIHYINRKGLYVGH